MGHLPVIASALLIARGCADTPVAGDDLGLWACGAIAGRQAWAFNSNPQTLQNHIAANATLAGSPVLVWDLAGPSNSSGTPVHVWGDYSDPPHMNQEWAIPASGSTGAIKSLYNSMCVSAQAAVVGSPLVIDVCNASDPLQQFAFNADDLSFGFPAVAGLCVQAGNTTASCGVAPFSSFPYCNASLPPETRLADLLSRMTLAEKAAALDTSVPAIPRLGVPSMSSGEALHGVIADCLAPGVAGPNSTGCPTSFPCPMALGAAFDPALWSDVGTAIGMEARALYNTPGGGGHLWVFSPNVNVLRDPRWGRAQEVPGEDPVLTSAYAAAYIGGLQGAGPGAADPAHMLVASTAKHFVAYDLEGYLPRTDDTPRPPTAVCDSPGGCQRWNFDASPPARDWEGFYLPAFIAAVGAGNGTDSWNSTASIMCSYNAVDGLPACASPLLKARLRDGLGWSGMVVSDCTAIELMQDAKYDGCSPPYPPRECKPSYFPGHSYTKDVVATANAALNAGTDVNCGPFYRMWLEGLATNGSVAEAALDAAVTRVYRTALRLGLLDPPAGQPYPAIPAQGTVDSAAHRALSLQAARESLVLLKNEPAHGHSQPVLPLPQGGQGLRLAFIGPHSNSTQSLLSNYHGSNTLVDVHSPLQAALARGLHVAYAPGTDICTVVPPGFPNMPCPDGMAGNASGFPEALAAAQNADVAVVFIGLDQTSEAENFDRSSISLPGVQEGLALAVAAVNPATIVVFISGGVVSSPSVLAAAPAVLYSFYPGQLGGEAIVDALTGVTSPAGRLPLTMYFSNFTQPGGRDIRDMDLARDGGVTHAFFTGPVVRPFGFGLSGYTTFSYQWAAGASVLRGSLDAGAVLAPRGSAAAPIAYATVTVTNTGPRESDVVVLGFILPPEGERLPGDPVQTLFGFQRLRSVGPGESRTVTLPIPGGGHVAGSAFGSYGAQGAGPWTPRPGAYRIRVGDVLAPAEGTLHLDLARRLD